MKVPFAMITATVNDASGSDVYLVADDGTVKKTLKALTSDEGFAKFSVQISTPPSSGSATIKFNAGTDAATSISVKAGGAPPPPPAP